MGSSVALAANRAKRTGPKFISFLSNVFKRKKWEEAPDPNAPIKMELRKAEKKHNVSFHALDEYHRGIIMLGRDNGAALNAFGNAIGLKPDCWYFYKGRAAALRELGKTELATADLKRAKGLHSRKNL